ncbi:hypothetical protein ACMHYJ_12250 [Castellaniella hirudinis]|uniref:hypothetical protein n=1 Tax=Castellaniella hirudinis TaxID=1144617 RepID=UPI0039C3981D
MAQRRATQGKSAQGRIMLVYGYRLRFYGALLLLCAAIYFFPTRFLVTVLGHGVVAYLPLSLVFLLMGTFVASFRDVEKQRTVLGVPTPVFCIGLAIVGCGMVAAYFLSPGLQWPRLGILLVLAAAEILLIRHEARRRLDRRRAAAVRESAHE